MESTVMISSLLCNILIGCFCIVVLSWAVVAIQTVINDFKREKREEKKAAQDDEYHIKRMESLKFSSIAGGLRAFLSRLFELR